MYSKPSKYVGEYIDDKLPLTAATELLIDCMLCIYYLLQYSHLVDTLCASLPVDRPSEKELALTDDKSVRQHVVHDRHKVFQQTSCERYFTFIASTMCLMDVLHKCMVQHACTNNLSVCAIVILNQVSHIEDCEGWWFVGHRSSVIEHWCSSQEPRVRPLVTAE